MWPACVTSCPRGRRRCGATPRCICCGSWSVSCTGPSKGNLFQAKIQASQDALAASLGIRREWANQILARLKAEGWIGVYAPRLPDGKYRPCLFWPGLRLKRLLCILVGYRRPHRSRVKSSPQSLPLSQAEREKSLSFLHGLREKLALQLGRGRP